MDQTSSNTPSGASRRSFLRTGSVLTGGALLASGATANPLSRLAGMAHPGADETLRVGLIGCGGRGTGAAANALRADPNVKLVAMGDAFPDMLENSLNSLNGQADLGGKIDVPEERRFTGFDAYKKVIDEVDVVLLATLATLPSAARRVRGRKGQAPVHREARRHRYGRLAPHSCRLRTRP